MATSPRCGRWASTACALTGSTGPSTIPGPWRNSTHFVAACKKVGLKVVFDNHNNEATPADWENAAQQKNGLWFDTGPGTDGTDGAGNKGTVTAAKFQEDWVRFAKHWAGNSTVIGFDLRNEPCAHTRTPALWGGKRADRHPCDV